MQSEKWCSFQIRFWWWKSHSSHSSTADEECDISWNRFSIVWCMYSSEIDSHDLIIVSHFSVDCFDLARFLDHQKERSNQIFITQHNTSSTKFSWWYDHEISDNESKKSKLAYSWSRCSTTRIIARSWFNDATTQLIDFAEFYWYLN